MPCEAMQRGVFQKALDELTDQLYKLKPQVPTPNLYGGSSGLLASPMLNYRIVWDGKGNMLQYVPVVSASTITPKILSPQKEAEAKELQLDVDRLAKQIADIDRRNMLHSHFYDARGNAIVKWFKTPQEKQMFDQTYPAILAQEQARDIVRPTDKPRPVKVLGE